MIIWLYLVNSLLLILHEIDAVYWKEWNLFFSGVKNEQKAMDGFLIFNFAAIALFLYGLVELVLGTFTGIIFSFILSITGILTFLIHSFFFAKRRKEFQVPSSLFILFFILIISIIQLIFSILLVIG
jgi:hypothetical protein